MDEPQRLAAILAAAFDEVVPDVVAVEAMGSCVSVGPAGRPHRPEVFISLDAFLQAEGNTLDELAWACDRALDHVQDHVVRTTTEPWPGERTMPMPDVRIQHDTLVLRYALGDQTVLEVARIPLRAIKGSASPPRPPRAT